MCSSLSKQKEQLLLLTGNLWGPTAGLGWLGTGSKGTAGKHRSLHTSDCTPKPTREGTQCAKWNTKCTQCAQPINCYLDTQVLSVYNSVQGDGRAELLSASPNSTSTSLHFNSECLFRTKVFCNRRRYYSPKIKKRTVFFTATSRLPRLSNRTYIFPLWSNTNLNLKPLESPESKGERRGKWNGQRKGNTQVHGVVTRTGYMPRRCLFSFCFVFKWAEFPSIYQKNKESNNFKTYIL